MTASFSSPAKAQTNLVATSLNVAFRWLLIGCTTVFALATSVNHLLPSTVPLPLLSTVVWVAGLSFLTALLALVGIGVTAIVLAPSTPTRQAPSGQGRRAPGIRLPLALSGLGLLLAIYYGLHVFWWNPLAVAPGYTLTEVYGQLAEAGEFSLVTVVGWGLTVALPLLALPWVHEWLSVIPSYTPLRAVGFCALVVAAASFLLYLGWGWHMGMGLADTFMTSGADRSPTAIPFGVAVLALGTLGIYGLFVPARAR
ncbi:hypothetical protein [Rothia nasimurium]|uniref:hypothetical protein n=1 Tax=Rothia nasimurium TaxID=85336 RepID=UPI001F262BE1|nr:hypothetical protein [Rothia nasimurium]